MEGVRNWRLRVRSNSPERKKTFSSDKMSSAKEYSVLKGPTFVLKAHQEVNCILLGFYAANSGNSLPTFRDNLSVPSSRVKSPKRRNYAKA